MTHDTFRLWYDAKLPKLSKTLQKQLVYCREVLEWSGRYAAPANDKTDILIRSKLEEIEPPLDGIRFKPVEYFDRDGFEHFYQIAAKNFWERLR